MCTEGGVGTEKQEMAAVLQANKRDPEGSSFTALRRN